MKNKNYLFLPMIFGLIVLGGLFIFTFFNKKQEISKSVDTQYEDTIQVTAPSETIIKETGEVDQEAFEKNQKLSDNNSLETLETELNNTVILKEDFSQI